MDVVLRHAADLRFCTCPGGLTLVPMLPATSGAHPFDALSSAVEPCAHDNETAA